MKRCITSLGILRRHVTLLDIMLCSSFVGNQGLEIDNNRFSKILTWSNEVTHAEKFTDFIVKACMHYARRWT